MELAKRELSLPDGKLYADENEFFSNGKLADILFVCTQDALHYGHAIRAMKFGGFFMFVAMAIVALFNLVMFLIKNQVINRILQKRICTCGFFRAV